jgi:hypothetical protein
MEQEPAHELLTRHRLGRPAIGSIIPHIDRHAATIIGPDPGVADRSAGHVTRDIPRRRIATNQVLGGDLRIGDPSPSTQDPQPRLYLLVALQMLHVGDMVAIRLKESSILFT